MKEKKLFVIDEAAAKRYIVDCLTRNDKDFL